MRSLLSQQGEQSKIITMLIVAVAASVVPARRAAPVNLSVALRSE